MQITNLATVPVAATAGGSLILTVEEANAGTQKGMVCVSVNPDVDIVLIDALGSEATTPGTVANSPLVCPAGVPTIIAHRSGPLRAISTSGTATVKRAIGCEP